jgi:gliding motility-associated-like protein
VGSTLCATKTITMAATGGTIYAWSGPLGFTSASASVSIPNATDLHSGNYTISISDLNGCSSTSVVNIHINPTPLVNVSSNAPICANQDINFTVNSPSGVQYFWSGPNGFNSTLQNPTLKNLEMDATGVYSVMVTDNIGCTKIELIPVVIRALPIVKVVSDKVGGCVPVCINFNVETNATLTQTKWDFGNGNLGVGNTGMACFTKPGVYRIESSFVDVYGCANKSVYSVEGYPIPTADFNISPVNPIIYDNVEFTDASYNANVTSWTWSFSQLKANQVMMNPVVNMTYENAGAYAAVLIVRSDKGCVDTIVKEIVIGDDFGIYVPDVFSPNGDGVNDVFQPKGFGIAKYELVIFDRWGEKLFTTTDLAQGWDGTFPKRKNQEVKQDVYVWQIKLTNVMGKSKEISGKVSLIK